MATWVLWGVINCQVGAASWLPEHLAMPHALCCALHQHPGACCPPRNQPRHAAGRGARPQLSPSRPAGPPPCLPACLLRLPAGPPPCLPSLQRKCDAYMAAQQQRRWDKGIEDFRNVDNGELRVGIMGLGKTVTCPPLLHASGILLHALLRTGPSAPALPCYMPVGCCCTPPAWNTKAAWRRGGPLHQQPAPLRRAWHGG